MKKLFNKAVVAVTVALGSTSAMALDPAAAVTEISGGSTAIEAIGLAVLGLCALILVIQKSKRATGG